MGLRRGLLFLVGLVLLQGQSAPSPGCVPAPVYPQPGQPGYDPYANRTVSVVGALIGPGKVNGTTWDGPGEVGSLATELAGALASSHPYVAVAAILAGPVAAGFESPDTGGRVELFVHGRLVAVQKLYKRKQQFTPTWSNPPILFENVDLRAARLRVFLVDTDLVAHDDMGTVDIDSASLMEAADSGGRFPFRAAEQTHNQVLFVDIGVL